MRGRAMSPEGGRLRGFGLLAALAVGSSAHAADCSTPYTIDELLADLTGVETAMRARSDSGAAEAGVKLRDGLGCLDEILPAPIAARAYRAVGAGLYSKGEPDDATKWFLTSLELEPTWEYGIQDIEEGHPLRNDFDALKLKVGGDPVAREGKAFGAGTHYLDGRKVTSPRARMERYHVYQVDGTGVQTHVIEGNAFPGENLVLAEGSDTSGGTSKGPKEKPEKQNKNSDPTEKQLAKAEAARKKAAEKQQNASTVKTKVGADGTVYYDRIRPKEKTPLIIIGSATMASAIGVYYAATRTSAKMDGIRTIYDVNPDLRPGDAFNPCRTGQKPGDGGCHQTPAAELDRLAGVTNRLVVSSLAVFAIGVGTTTWGAIVDGGTVVPTVNIRF